MTLSFDSSPKVRNILLIIGGVLLIAATAVYFQKDSSSEQRPITSITNQGSGASTTYNAIDLGDDLPALISASGNQSFRYFDKEGVLQEYSLTTKKKTSLTLKKMVIPAQILWSTDFTKALLRYSGESDDDPSTLKLFDLKTESSISIPGTTGTWLNATTLLSATTTDTGSRINKVTLDGKSSSLLEINGETNLIMVDQKGEQMAIMASSFSEDSHTGLSNLILTPIKQPTAKIVANEVISLRGWSNDGTLAFLQAGNTYSQLSFYTTSLETTAIPINGPAAWNENTLLTITGTYEEPHFSAIKRKDASSVTSSDLSLPNNNPVNQIVPLDKTTIIVIAGSSLWLLTLK